MAAFTRKKLISLLLFIFLVFFVIPALRNPSTDLLELPLKFFDFLDREFKAVISYRHNFFENKKLSQAMASLRQRLVELDELSLENQRLRDLLEFKKGSPHSLITARVIARDPSSWSSVVVIDKGKKDQIVPNLAVITSAGLVGRIVEVGNSTSKVILLNNLNFAVSAIVQRSRQEGLVTGTLENRLVMRYLPSDSDLKPGDILLSSGLTKIFPKGLLIGKVAEIEKEFSGLSLFCLIEPAVDLRRLEEVLVILK